ncbi:hypothetical protein ACLK17_11075 [Escherichia coli]
MLNLLALRFANSLFVNNWTIAPLIMLRLPWQKKWGSKGAGAI